MQASSRTSSRRWAQPGPPPTLVELQGLRRLDGDGRPGVRALQVALVTALPARGHQPHRAFS